MTQHSSIPVRDSITTQLLLKVFSYYLLIALTVTLVHMATEYFYTKDQVQKELQLFEETYKDSLAQTLWDMNMEQLQVTLSGMLRFPIIAGIKLEDGKGRVVGAEGSILNQKGG